MMDVSVEPPNADVEDARLHSSVRAALFGESEPVRIGRFVIEDLIGRGGMGVVYRALDEQLGRRVAVKLLQLHSANRGASGSERLLREARALARLSHPHVVTVHEVGHHDGQVFLAMELVRGASLRAWWDGKRLPEVLRVLRQAGDGLAAAHQAGLVHRDFKPDNIVIDEAGGARVLDFGLAVGTDTDDAEQATLPDAPAWAHELVTRTGSLAGTPAYMAPERLLGAPADRLSDQFAFAVTAWEALTGQAPFDARTVPELLLAMRAGPPMRPSGRRVPGTIVSALRRGMDPDPHRRWPSVAALTARLRTGRSRWWWVGGAAGVVVSVGVALAAVGPAGPSDDEQQIEPAGYTLPPPTAAAKAAIDARDYARATEELARLSQHAQEIGSLPLQAEVAYLTTLARLSVVPSGRTWLWYRSEFGGAGFEPPRLLLEAGLAAAKQSGDPGLQARLEAIRELWRATENTDDEPPRSPLPETRDVLARGVFALARARRAANEDQWHTALTELRSVDAEALRAVRTDPLLDDLRHWNEVVATARVGNVEESISTAQRRAQTLAASSQNDEGSSELALAWVLVYAGKLEEAAEALERVRVAAPASLDHSSWAGQVALVSLRLGRYDDALRAARDAHETTRGWAEQFRAPLAAAELLGWPQVSSRLLLEVVVDALVAKGEWAAAHTTLAAARTFGSDWTPLLWAEVYVEAGEIEAAREQLDKVVNGHDTLDEDAFIRMLRVSGSLALAEGDRKDGLRRLRQAASRERERQGHGGSPRLLAHIEALIGAAE